MKRIIPTIISTIIAITVTAGQCSAAYHVDGRATVAVHETQGQTIKTLIANLKTVEDALSDNRVDDALDSMKAFDAYLMADGASRVRVNLAKSLRATGRSTEAAEQLIMLRDYDPFCREAPDALELLADIQNNDLNDPSEAQDTLVKLAVRYFPLNPAVMKARTALGQAIQTPPKNKMILLDEQFSGASVYDRSYFGSYNGGQWEVLSLLSSSGYTVHIANRNTKDIPLDILQQYGMIMLHEPNGTNDNKNSMPANSIDNFVKYVENGGSLLVLGCATGRPEDTVVKFTNSLLSQFGLGFQQTNGIGGKPDTIKVESHPALKGITGFTVSSGTPVTTTGDAKIIAYCKDNPIIEVKDYGKGKVIAAGIGFAFRGCAIGAINRAPADVPDTIPNKNLLMSLTNYLVSPSN